jgi:NTE family protein
MGAFKDMSPRERQAGQASSPRTDVPHEPRTPPAELKGRPDEPKTFGAGQAGKREAGGRPPFGRIALVLQGGGALGSYQGGAYQALAEADLHPDWVAGISIGAFNSAIIAGNRKEDRVERLRSFWELVSESPIGLPTLMLRADEFVHRLINQTRALNILLFGTPNFFSPRWPPPLPFPSTDPAHMSYYDVTPVRSTLGQHVDFDILNNGETRLSVGTVNVRTGNFLYFDTETHRIGVDHILASGALPPGFPAVEIEGEYYWDGGVLSNTPLDWVLASPDRRNTLAFQIDLWSAGGNLPRDLVEADLRQKEIRFSSRTRVSIEHFQQKQRLRRAMSDLLKNLPPELKQTPECELLAEYADDKDFNIITLVYHAQNYEGSSKDYEFSRRTMEEHWERGYNDTVRTLRHPEVLERPKSRDGVLTFDVAVDGRL